MTNSLLVVRYMDMCQSVSRKAFLATMASGVAGLIVPSLSFGDVLPTVQSVDGVVALGPVYTDEEIDTILHAIAEQEVERLIEAAKAEKNIETYGRTTYSTVYGPKVYRSSGKHVVAGQLAGGVKFQSGGSVSVSRTGGGSLGASVSLPGGVGSISVSIPLCRYSRTVTEYQVKIPGGAYYKVTAAEKYAYLPYVVYATTNGVKKVYKKMCSSTLYSLNLGYRRV